MFWGGLNGDGFADESDYDYGSYAEGPYYRNRAPYKPRSVTCARCGCTDLYWKKTENGWRLSYGASSKLWGKLHACDLEGESSMESKVNHFNTVQDVIDMDGFDYAFESYSNWEEIDDAHFHKLRLTYLDAMQDLANYIALQVDEDD